MAEAGALLRLDPVAKRDDHIEIVVLDLIGFPVGGSMCKFCTYCFYVEFSLPEDVADVLGDDRTLTPEQLAHLLLPGPDRVPLQTHVHPGATVGRLVDENFAAWGLRHHTALPRNFSEPSR